MCSCVLPDVSTSHIKKGKGAKKSRHRAGKGEDEEAGEETDEGDMEGLEVDYMSRSSSESEEEFQVKIISTNKRVHLFLFVNIHMLLEVICDTFF